MGCNSKNIWSISTSEVSKCFFSCVQQPATKKNPATNTSENVIVIPTFIVKTDYVRFFNPFKCKCKNNLSINGQLNFNSGSVLLCTMH